MAAPKQNQNAVGNPGGGAPAGVDREKSKKLRNTTIDRLQQVLDRPIVEMSKEDYEFYKAVLLKLAGTVLPRLNEHTGEDGGAIITQLVQLPERTNENTMASQPRDTNSSPENITV